MGSSWEDGDGAQLVDALRTKAGQLCPMHNHLTGVIPNPGVPVDRVTDDGALGKATFDLAPVVRRFLYQHVREFS